MDEKENPRDGARGEAGNSTPGDNDANAGADAGTDTDDTPSNDASDGNGSADSSVVEDDVSPEDIDIQASIGPNADASDASDEDLDQHKDPDVGLDRVVLNGDEGLKGLFSGLLAGKPIFENKEVLRPSYTPCELPHRIDRINQMATILISALRGEAPSNILIYEKTGTGKTTSAKFVSQELESTFQKYDVPCEVEYINCKVTDAQYRVLTQLADKLTGKNVERIEAGQEHLDEMHTRATEGPNALKEAPYDSIVEIDEHTAELGDDADEMETAPITGRPTGHVYMTFFDAADYKGQVIVVMLDEIGKLVKKSGDDMLYNLSRMNSKLDNSRISIMGISNDLKFTDFFGPRIRSSPGEGEIIFPPYDANQLRNILQHRADMAFRPDAFTDDTTSLCAAFTMQEHGDARRALDSLHTAGELTEHGQVNTVEEAHVRQAQDRIELNRVVGVIRTLPTQSKIILFTVILLEKSGAHNINTGEMLSIYKCLYEEIDADVLAQHRVTDLILRLDMFDIVNAVVVSRSRYGRTKEISLSIPIDGIEAVLPTDPRLDDIENAQSFVQARFDN